MVAIHPGGTIQWPWPPEACAVFSHREYRDDFRLVQAWISIPVSRLTGLLDTVRNRLLSFVLEMKTLDLDLEDESLSGASNKVIGAQITQTFHQTIFGPVSNVGTALSRKP
jgi:AbiTii